MNIAQGPVSFEDVIVEVTQEEWRQMDSDQRTLYREVMLENYSHLISMGYCITKPQVIFKLEQGEDPWSLEEEFLNKRSPGYYKVDLHIEENQEKQEKPLWQVIFIDNKILSEGQKILGKPINLDITPDFSGEMPYKCDSCRMNLLLVSDLIISDRNYSRKKTDNINVCEKLQLYVKHEKTHIGDRSYKYNKNVKFLSHQKGQQKFQTPEQPFECNEFGTILHDNIAVCVTAKSSLTGQESCKDDEFGKNCDKATLFNHIRTGTGGNALILMNVAKPSLWNTIKFTWL